MTQLFIYEMKNFQINSDEAQLRDSDEYQQIRSEINRRFNPLAGVTDWERVKLLCEKLACNHGVDLLVSIYFTVASVKTQGLQGLANGLELQSAVLSCDSTSTLPSSRITELYQWMLERIGHEIKSLRPGHSQLRELYRCERALQLIDSQLTLLSSGNIPALDSLGFTLFEHIDKLETTQSISMVTKVEKSPIVKWLGIAILLGVILGIGFSGLIQLFQYYHQPLESIITKSYSPNVFYSSTGLSLHEKPSIELLEKYRPELIAFYTSTIKRLVIEPYQSPSRVLALSTTLTKFYPNDSQVKLLAKTVEKWNNKYSNEFIRLSERFTDARTHIANLELFLEKGDITKAISQAKDLDQYAESLSPLLSRMLYIESMIKNKNNILAKQELTKLDMQLISLLLEKSRLENIILQHQ